MSEIKNVFLRRLLVVTGVIVFLIIGLPLAIAQSLGHALSDAVSDLREDLLGLAETIKIAWAGKNDK